MKKPLPLVLSLIGSTVVAAAAYLVFLPPIHWQATEFWIFLTAMILVYGLPLTMILSPDRASAKGKPDAQKTNQIKLFKMSKPTKILVAAALLPVVVIMVGGIISSPFFNAKAYASVITVEEAVFAEDMPEADSVTNISLMDTDSAIILGNRELGALSDVVSQYELSADYNQINYQHAPRKVANLEYADFFKWIGNAERGIPGYVTVDPVNSEAEYIEFSRPLKYVDSGYWGDDLMRKLRLSYPTKIFGGVNFEIDEQGDPWFIVSCMTPRVGLFGARDVTEVIIFNPCDGTSDICAVADTPTWVDNVYDGYLACEKYDWFGTLNGGWFNSVVGQKDCKQTTSDFGYIVLEDDVWYFTGVTSLTADESNIGFMMSNARTGAYKYYPVAGAEEYSAMGAAQGEVQHKGYVAAFPSLINIRGEATYIMVLKDNTGLVKLHALVNVENISVVATGDTQEAAKKAYIALLERNGLIEEKPQAPEDTKIAVVTIIDVRLATVSGETVVYLTDTDGVVYKGNLAEDETLILIQKGHHLEITYEETDHKAIRLIHTWTEKAADQPTA